MASIFILGAMLGVVGILSRIFFVFGKKSSVNFNGHIALDEFGIKFSDNLHFEIFKKKKFF